jgi:hypothetical protein
VLKWPVFWWVSVVSRKVILANFLFDVLVLHNESFFGGSSLMYVSCLLLVYIICLKRLSDVFQTVFLYYSTTHPVMGFIVFSMSHDEAILAL